MGVIKKGLGLKQSIRVVTLGRLEPIFTAFSESLLKKKGGEAERFAWQRLFCRVSISGSFLEIGFLAFKKVKTGARKRHFFDVDFALRPYSHAGIETSSHKERHLVAKH